MNFWVLQIDEKEYLKTKIKINALEFTNFLGPHISLARLLLLEALNEYVVL